MALANYGDLKTGVANWLNRDDLTSRIPELIRMGEARVYADFRLRCMEVSAAVTIASSTRTKALPTRWVQGRRLYLSGVGHLEYKTPVEFWEIHADRPTGQPDVFTIEAENFVWGPLPDQAYSATSLHYASFAIMATDGDAPALFVLAPQVYLYAALIEAAPFLGNDPRVQIWAGLYDDLKDRLHAADARDRYSGDTRTQTKEAQRT